MERNFEYMVVQHELKLLNDEEKDFFHEAQNGGMLYVFTNQTIQYLNHTACVMWNIIRKNCFFLKAKEEITQLFQDELKAENVTSFFDFLIETGAIEIVK